MEKIKTAQETKQNLAKCQQVSAFPADGQEPAQRNEEKTIEIRCTITVMTIV